VCVRTTLNNYDNAKLLLTTTETLQHNSTTHRKDSACGSLANRTVKFTN